MFELVVLFSGLCFFSESNHTAYLVNAVNGKAANTVCHNTAAIPKHIPILSYMVGRLTPLPWVEKELKYSVDDDGRLIASLPLAERNICFRYGELGTCSCTGTGALWSQNPSGNGNKPNTPDDEIGHRWISKLSDLGNPNSLPGLDPDVTDLAKFEKAISRVVLSGEFQSRRIAKNAENAPIVWKKNKDLDYKALAGDVAVHQTNLNSRVSIYDCTARKDMLFVPADSRGKVRIAISNLPHERRTQPTKLQHFRMFYDLLNWDTNSGCPTTVVIPSGEEPSFATGVMGGNVFCPPSQQ